MGKEVQIKALHLLNTSKIMVEATCDYCGKSYKSTVGKIRHGMDIDGTNACRYCAAKKSRKLDSNKRSKSIFNRLYSICAENNYKLITLDDGTLNSESIIEYECRVHGVQRISATNMLQGHKCYYCGRKKTGDKLRKSELKVISDIESINNNKLLNPSDYIDGKTSNLEVLCSCGNTFIVSYNNYMKGTCRCRSCTSKSSNGEKMIEDILNQMSVEYKREYRFADCRDKKPLPFDFYLPKYNKIIEFDGQIHFEEIKGRNHKLTVMHDCIKNNYCECQNIPLLRIPYWEGHNMEKLIIDFLNG